LHDYSIVGFLLIIDKPIADLAAFLSRSHGWKLPDAFQAAYAAITRLSFLLATSKILTPGNAILRKFPMRYNGKNRL
jgi:hypothetical protein